MVERMLWMLEEIKQAIIHMERARAYWEQEERERHGELMTLHDKPVRCLDCRKLVGGAGVEPATSCVSSKRSTAELTALGRDNGETKVDGFTRPNSSFSIAVQSMSRYGSSGNGEEMPEKSGD